MDVMLRLPSAGVEALFADLGHFSRPAIQMSAFSLLLPSLWLTYLGQGAYLTKNPDQVSLAVWVCCAA